MRRSRIAHATLALLIGLFAAHSAVASGSLQAYFPTTYRVSKNGFRLGLAKRQLQTRPDGTLLFTSHAKPTGLASLFVSDEIVERSVIHRQNGHLQPLSYSYDQSGGRHHRAWSLHFDWKAKHVTSSYHGVQHPLAPNTQDLLSFELALMLDLQAGKRDFTYPIVDRKEVHDYRFTTVGHQTLRTAVGTLKTLKLVHKNVHDEGSFVFWCAENYGYLPVRIERTGPDGGKVTLAVHSMPGKKTQYRNPDRNVIN